MHPGDVSCTTSNCRAERHEPIRRGNFQLSSENKTAMTTASKNIGWIGVGKMGLPMSVLVAKAGYAVTAFDHSQHATCIGARTGHRHRQLTCRGDQRQPVVITSLPDDRALRAVALGPNGIISAMAPTSVLIETSTVSAEVSGEVGAAANARDIVYLRVPVSGNASIAHTGALTCFVSGPQAAFESVQAAAQQLHPRADLSRHRRRSALRQARGQPDDRGRRRP